MENRAEILKQLESLDDVQLRIVLSFIKALAS